MSVLEVDSSNACIPQSSPLYSLIPPLPSTTRGESLKSLDSYTLKDKTVVLYGNGRLIVCRYIFHGESSGIQAFIYRGHMAHVTCARFSPSGAYVASSDIKGALRVWSFDNEEHLCKLNLPRALGGPIRDISWDKQNRRICIVGDTSPSNVPCRFINWNTGVTCGELGIHQRNRVSSCIVRKNTKEKQGYNSYTVLTGGREDHSIIVNSNGARSFECNDVHVRGAIHSIQFSEDGCYAATVGADHTICIFEYDSTSYLQIKHKIEEGHTGSIYACDFKGDVLITCSVDGTVKYWNVGDGTLIKTIDIKSMFLQEYDEDFQKSYKGGMQIGCKFIADDKAVSISSNGRITILSDDIKVLMGHQAPIAAMTYHDNILYTGDTDSVICKWDVSKNECLKQINGVEKVHSGTITSLQYVKENGVLLSVGWDDMLRVTKGDEVMDSIKLEYQPNLIVGGKNISAIVTVGGIVLVKEGKLISDTISLPYEALSACISPDDTILCLGGKDHNIYIYTFQNNTIHLEQTIQSGHLRPIHSLSFSHDSKYLASGDTKDICIWNFSRENCTPLISKNRWCFHSQKITSLAWNPVHTNIIASAGLDDSIYIWNLDKKMKRVCYNFSHRGGINGMVFLDGFLLLSVGGDGCVCTWDVRGDLERKFGMKF